MPRICFTLQVRPDRLEEYTERHAHVWPEMLRALSASGWHDYSLFLRDDGLLVGYAVVHDYAAVLAAMAATEVNARWQADMAQYFEPLATGAADSSATLLHEVFHLEDQLAALEG